MARNKPLYKSVATYRDYQLYAADVEYIMGWNDAMDFIFPEAKKERERERIKRRLKENTNGKGGSDTAGQK